MKQLKTKPPRLRYTGQARPGKKWYRGQRPRGEEWRTMKLESRSQANNALRETGSFVTYVFVCVLYTNVCVMHSLTTNNVKWRRVQTTPQRINNRSTQNNKIKRKLKKKTEKQSNVRVFVFYNLYNIFSSTYLKVYSLLMNFISSFCVEVVFFALEEEKSNGTEDSCVRYIDYHEYNCYYPCGCVVVREQHW